MPAPASNASANTTPDYLAPYERAAATHGAGFSALLWTSPATQEARFAAFTRAAVFDGRAVLDIGCGRADFLDYLLKLGIKPAHYVGLEAIETLASAAEAKRRPNSLIIRADFVREPQRMFVGAERVVISGALNTLGVQEFYQTLRRAYDASAEMLIFNFLDSPQLAGASYLSWHHPQQVLSFCRAIAPRVQEISGYLEGDRTVVIYREQ
jgi:SAM-dependent methyltransferase